MEAQSQMKARDEDVAAITELSRAVVEGLVILFVGAGIHRAPVAIDTTAATPDTTAATPPLPDGRSLARQLAVDAGFTLRGPCLSQSQIASLFPRNPDACSAGLRCWPNEAPDLISVAQIVASRRGSTYLEALVAASLRRPLRLTIVHELIREICNQQSQSVLTGSSPYPLIITTNYDDTLEQALNGNIDLIYLGAKSPRKASKDRTEPGFWIRTRDEKVPTLYTRPKNPRDEISRLAFCRDRPLIVKIHGTLKDEALPGSGFLIISEDDYIDFLMKETLRLPGSIESRLRNNSFLFLGYSLSDWN